LSGQVTWAVNGVDGGSAANGTITASGLYTAPSASKAPLLQISVHPQTDAIAAALAYVSVLGSSNFPPGTVSATSNPQVARYSVSAPQNSSVQIAFGPTTAYGLTTWTQPAPPFGGTVSILVAGMLTNTTYHMQAVVVGADGNCGLQVFECVNIFHDSFTDCRTSTPVTRNTLSTDSYTLIPSQISMEQPRTICVICAICG